MIILAGGIGFLFSQFVTIGTSFSFRSDWSFCFENWQAILVWAIETLCYGYVFYVIALGSLSILQNLSTGSETNRINLRKWFLIILSVKLIYFIALFPCVFDIDASIGLRTFLDPDSATCDHHPFLIQLLHGTSYLFGQSLGSPSLGFALLSLVSICVSSGILIYGLSLFEQANIGRRSIMVAALVFAFFPLFPYLNLLITKDGLFAYFFLLYLFSIYELYLTQGNCLKNPRFIALHTTAILFVCLTRHQGIYLVILEFFLLLFCYKNYWKRISAMTIPALILYFCYSNILLPSLNVEPSGKQEIYGTLFHQTARCLNEYPNEETESERKAIDAIFDRDIIIQNYSYDLTDGSKDCYKYNPMIFTSINTPVYFRHINRSNESQELEAYRSAWLSMFLRHPLSCIQATLGVCIGFFFNNDDPLVKVEPHWATARFAITPKYEFWHFRIFEYIYYKVAYHLARIPVICWIFAIPYYIWVAIIALSLLLYRKDLSWNIHLSARNLIVRIVTCMPICKRQVCISNCRCIATPYYLSYIIKQ